jgi:peptide chain release factor subunit 1
MEKSTFALETPLREQLTRLAAFEPVALPVLSLYLDMRPDGTGRRQVDRFLADSFTERPRTLSGERRRSFDEDAQRITEFIGRQVKPSAKAVAIFACAGADQFFEAIQLDAPVQGHSLIIDAVPHLYSLARLNDQYPRYAAVLVDGSSARLFVFSLAATELRQDVRGTKTRRTAVGGWSQARYQRHVDELRQHHLKDVVAMLERVVQEEQINHIVLSCDDVTRAAVVDLLPKMLAAKVIEVGRLESQGIEGDILHRTLEALRQRDAEGDVARVESMLGAWHAGGLGVAGPDETLMALSLGEVEELLITATPQLLRRASRAAVDPPTPEAIDVTQSDPQNAPDSARMKLADDLVTKAQQSSSRIRFIEDPGLLADVGGVGAILRFRVSTHGRGQRPER